MDYRSFKPFETINILDAGHSHLRAVDRERDYFTFENKTYSAHIGRHDGRSILAVCDEHRRVIGRRWL